MIAVAAAPKPITRPPLLALLRVNFIGCTA